jgi:hypothetical protein
LFKKVIRYSSLNLKYSQQRESSARSQTSEIVNPPTPAELESTRKEVYDDLARIKKSEIVEIKAMRAPPMALQQVGEATCLLFTQPPKYDNFRKLISSRPNFIDDLNKFDLDSVSDFTLGELNKYIINPNFTKEYVSQISRFSAALCSWIRYVHQYCLIKSMVIKTKIKYIHSK